MPFFLVFRSLFIKRRPVTGFVRLNLSLLLGSIFLSVLPLKAAQSAPNPPLPVKTLSAKILPAQTLPGQTLSGQALSERQKAAFTPFIRGLQALQNFDFQAAAGYFTQARFLAPEISLFTRYSFTTSLAAGQPNKRLARRLPKTAPAVLYLFNQALRQGNFSAATEELNRLPDTLPLFQDLKTLLTGLLSPKPTVREKLNRSLNPVLWHDYLFFPAEFSLQKPDTSLLLQPDSPILDSVAKAEFAFAVSLQQNNKDFPALLFLRLSTELRPDFVPVRFALAGLLAKHGQFHQALEVLTVALPPETPFHEALLIDQARVYAALGNITKMNKICAALAARFPTSPAPYALQGTLLLENRFPQEAVTPLGRAIILTGKNNRQSRIFYYQRGIAFNESGNWPAARKDLEKSLELGSLYPYVMNYLSYGLAVHEAASPGALKKAYLLASEALILMPDNPAFTDTLGYVLLQQKHPAEALALFLKADHLSPGNPYILSHLGDARFALGQTPQALSAWLAAFRAGLPPQSARALEEKIRQLSQKARTDRLNRLLQEGFSYNV